MLIFAGKRVGASILDYLIERNEPISRVIASSHTDVEVLETSERAGIPVSVFKNDTMAGLSEAGTRFTWLLNLWSPHLITSQVLRLCGRRVNLHPSLVPYGRGSDSSAWTIRKAFPGGVSLIDISDQLDEGDLYAQMLVPACFPIRGSLLHETLQDHIIALFKAAWPDIKEGKIVPVPQRKGGSSHRRAETNADRVKDAECTMTIAEAITWMLAHDFAPGTTAEVILNRQRYRVRVEIQKIS